MTLEEARAILAAQLPEGVTVASYAWEDATDFWMVALHPPFGEPSPDGGAVLVNKATATVSPVSALADRARLERMRPVGEPVPR
jgi:hypothetical protein